MVNLRLTLLGSRLLLMVVVEYLTGLGGMEDTIHLAMLFFHLPSILLIPHHLNVSPSLPPPSCLHPQQQIHGSVSAISLSVLSTSLPLHKHLQL